MWEYIKIFQEDVLGYVEKDWFFYLGLMFLYNRNLIIFRIVLLIISRIWYVGDNDFGFSVDFGVSSKYKFD